MLLRLFTAISLPDEVLDRLTMLEGDLYGASWRDRDALHLTLAFYGDLDHAAARELDTELAAIRAAPLTLSLDGIGWFGRREPTAVWAGVAPNAELGQLAHACERAGRRLGIDMPRRPYRPHVTLAYCRGTSLTEVGAYQNEMREFRTEPFEVSQFELYSSHQTKSQNRYDEEATYPLGDF